MTAKEYLRRIRDAESDLRSAEMDYQRARDDVMNLKAIEYDKDKVSNSHIGDLSDAIAALEKYAELVNAKWGELIAMREEAKERIGEIADGRYREVLHRRIMGIHCRRDGVRIPNGDVDARESIETIQGTGKVCLELPI